MTNVDFDKLAQDLDQEGHSVLTGLLSATECAVCSTLFDDEARFRSRIVMEAHGYGQGEYRYFDYPLPELVQRLRTELYRGLVSVANAWAETLAEERQFPPEHSDYLAQCHQAGQCRPTPLLLSYQAGDYNRLHQDLYGEQVFPLQVAILLSEPEEDFTGGEFVLTEQRPRSQSRATVVPLRRGDAVVFAVRDRPVLGQRGPYRSKLRHGVSQIRSGQRRTLGLIFHDAT